MSQITLSPVLGSDSIFYRVGGGLCDFEHNRGSGAQMRLFHPLQVQDTGSFPVMCGVGFQVFRPLFVCFRILHVVECETDMR